MNVAAIAFAAGLEKAAISRAVVDRAQNAIGARASKAREDLMATLKRHPGVLLNDEIDAAYKNNNQASKRWRRFDDRRRSWLKSNGQREAKKIARAAAKARGRLIAGATAGGALAVGAGALAYRRHQRQKTAAQVHFVERSTERDRSFGVSGRYVTGDIVVGKKPIGEMWMMKHDAGPVEVTGMFIHDKKHRGKGYARTIMDSILREHGSIISDTSGGTTRSAQRAMRSLVRRQPGVVVHDLKSRNLDGERHRDIDDRPTSVWLASRPGAPAHHRLWAEDKVHDAMYHRRRQSRSFGGLIAGGMLGMAGGALAAHHLGIRDIDTALPGFMILGGSAGALLGAQGVAHAQYAWDRRKNLRLVNGQLRSKT